MSFSVNYSFFYVLFSEYKKQYSIFTNEKDSSLKISVKIFRTPGNSPEKRLGLTKKDNCVKGLRLLCRRSFKANPDPFQDSRDYLEFFRVVPGIFYINSTTTGVPMVCRR